MGEHRYHVFLSHSSADKPAVKELARWLVREGLTPFLDEWNLIPGENWIPALVKSLAESQTCAVFFGPAANKGGWQTEEVEQALIRRAQERNRGAGDQFRTIPVLLPGASPPGVGEFSAFNFIASSTWVKFEQSLDEEEPRHRLVCGIKGAEPGDRQNGAVEAGECPYRGLDVFDVQHAKLFFGREKLTHDLVEMLAAILRNNGPRLLAVLGPSGSGKSSIVRAGLIPALEKGILGNSACWRRVIFKPGQDPFENLGLALATLPAGAGLLAETRDFLGIKRFGRDDPRSLHTAARLATRPDPHRARLLVVVDQFEEVFTQCSSDDDRQALIENLLHAATVPDGPVVVVLALRADFLGACAGYRELADAISGRQKLVGAMIEDELRWAIEKPAALAGGMIEPDLVEQLLEDVGTDRGALPLLEFVLTQLWKEKAGLRMTGRNYRKIGGLRGALKLHADSIVESLKERGLEDTCRRVLLDLIELGKGTDDTRRRVAYRQVAISREWSRVVETLISERLITASHPQATEKGTIEIVHESLIKNWTLLQGWVDANRKSIETRSELEAAADRWVERDRHADYLLVGLPLENALAWAKAVPDDLARLASVQEFLSQSEASQKRRKDDALEIERRLRENAEAARFAEQKRAEAAEAQQIAERQRAEAAESARIAEHGRAEAASAAARLQKRFSQRLLATAIVAIAFFLVAGGLGWWAEVERKSVERAAKHERLANTLTESRRLAALSGEVLSQRLDLAMLLALEATSTDTLEAWSSLHRVHNDRPLVSRFFRVPQGEVTGVTAPPDGRIVALYDAGDKGGTAVFDSRGDCVTSASFVLKEGSVASLAYGPNDQIAVAYSALGSGGVKSVGGVVVFDATGKRVSAAPLEVKQGEVRCVAFGRNGCIAVAYFNSIGAGSRSGVVLFDANGKRVNTPPLDAKPGIVTSLAFDRERRLAVGYSLFDPGGVVVTFDTTGKREIPAPLEVNEGAVTSVTYSPRGRLAVGFTSLFSGGVVVFDQNGKRALPAPLKVKEGGVTSVAFDQHERLAVGYTLPHSGGVVVFDENGKLAIPAPLEVKEGRVQSVAFGKDGRLAAGYSGDVTSGVIVFDPHSERVSRALLPVREGEVRRVAYARNAGLAAVYSTRGGPGGTRSGVVFFDANENRVISAPLEAAEVSLKSVVFSEDGRLAVGYSGAGRADRVVIFDASGSRADPSPLEVPEGTITSVAFGRDGRLAAGYSSSPQDSVPGGVVVFDSSGDRMKFPPLDVNEGKVMSVAFGPNESLVTGYSGAGGKSGVVVFDPGGKRVRPASPYRRTNRSFSWPDDIPEEERKQSEAWELANPGKIGGP